MQVCSDSCVRKYWIYVCICVCVCVCLRVCYTLHVVCVCVCVYQLHVLRFLSSGQDTVWGDQRHVYSIILVE